jgi:hypothetical protein
VSLPVFVLVHESRSGSTFLADILSRHPDISIAPESSVLKNAWKWEKIHNAELVTEEAQLHDLVGALYKDKKLQVWGVSSDVVMEAVLPKLPVAPGEVARQILVSYGRMRHPGSTIFGIKRGGWNAFNLTTIRRLLPRVRFLHIVRDGRAVYASEKRARHRDTGQPFQKSATAAAWRWQLTVRAFGEKGGAGLEIRYEDLLLEPQRVLSSILAFLDTDNTQETIDAMLQARPSTYVSRSRQVNHPNVGKIPLVERINAWRNELTPKEIRTFEKVAGSALSEKGYELSFPQGKWDNVYRSIIDMRHRLDRRFKSAG